MTTVESRRNLEEFARRGAEAYDRYVRPNLCADDDNKYVAIDVVTGDYEMDPNSYNAIMRLRSRRPAENIWLARVGHPAAFRLRRGA